MFLRISRSPAGLFELGEEAGPIGKTSTIGDVELGRTGMDSIESKEDLVSLLGRKMSVHVSFRNPMSPS